MSTPILPPIECEKCRNMGRKSFYQELENSRYADQQGRLCCRAMCFVCGMQLQGGVPLIIQTKQCSCPLRDSWVKAGPEVNAANSSLDYLNAMRSTQAIPDSRTFLNQTRPTSVPGSGQ